MIAKKSWKQVISGLLLVALGACGGGGEPSSSTPTPALYLLAGNVGELGVVDIFGVLGNIATDRVGNLFVTDIGLNAVHKITPIGIVTTLITFTRSSNPGLLIASSITLDGKNNIYYAATVNSSNSNSITSKIFKITPDVNTSAETVVTLPYAFSGAPRIQSFNSSYTTLKGFAFDSLGNIYTSGYFDIDTGTEFAQYSCFGSRVLKISTTGNVSTFAGAISDCGYADGTASNATFTSPGPPALDSANNIYVADHTVVRKITPEGVVSTVAGSGDIYGSADGVGVAARFTSASSIAIDQNNNLYVADNSLIRKITPAGVVTTIAGTPGNTSVKLGALPGSLSTVHGLAVSGNKLYITTDSAVLWMLLP